MLGASERSERSFWSVVELEYNVRGRTLHLSLLLYDEVKIDIIIAICMLAKCLHFFAGATC